MECPLLNFNDELIPTGTGSFRFREMKCRKKVQKNLSLGTKLIVCQGFGSVFFLRIRILPESLNSDAVPDPCLLFTMLKKLYR